MRHRSRQHAAQAKHRQMHQMLRGRGEYLLPTAALSASSASSKDFLLGVAVGAEPPVLLLLVTSLDLRLARTHAAHVQDASLSGQQCRVAEVQDYGAQDACSATMYCMLSVMMAGTPSCRLYTCCIP